MRNRYVFLQELLFGSSFNSMIENLDTYKTDL